MEKTYFNFNLDIKNKPGDYSKIDDFLEKGNRVGKGRFNQKFSKDGKLPHKGKSTDFKQYQKKGKQNRPGKIKRMIQRNKKFSKKK